MSADWKRLCRDSRLRVQGSTIYIAFHDKRRQVVHVEIANTKTIRLWSPVARRSAISWLESPLMDAWRRNRFTELVSFTLDDRERMIGESWVPTAGLTADEWSFYVNNLARACDRFEYLLTGRDEP